MALVELNRKDIEKITGKISDEKMDEFLSMFGTAVEKIDENIEVEVAPNRPDLLSQKGIERALKSYLNKEKGLKEYKLKKPEKDFIVKIDHSVKEIRPFTSCAIVKNLDLNEEKIKEIISLQEKLHVTLGRNRKKAAIGVYPLDKIKLPIVYKAEKPEKIRFQPLDYDRELNGNEILKKHPAGKDYAHLLDGLKMFPIFIDSNSKILSMPPIINSEETGRIDKNTKEVFIECSGWNLESLNKTLNILVTTLSDMGGDIYQMNLHGKENVITPDLTPDKIKLDINHLNKLLGLKLREKDVEKLLLRMGFGYKRGIVFIPAWRTDILHEVDIIEDAAIAYGYENFKSELPDISTIGGESPKARFLSKIAENIIGLGVTEISTYHLIKKSEAEAMKIEKRLEVENSKTEYKILRPNLLIPSLRVFSENKDKNYPQKIFEIGTIFSNSVEDASETGIKEQENLIISISPSNFTEIKKILSYIGESLGIKFKLKETMHDGLIEGRTASVIMDQKIIGYLGEVHPETLREWSIKMPISVLEINLNEIFDFVKKQDQPK